MLSVVWRAAPPSGDPKLEMKCAARQQWFLAYGGHEIPLTDWWIAEDRIRPPIEAATVPAGRIVQVRGGVRRPVPVKVGAGGVLEFANDEARGAFLSILVAMRLDKATPYRPGAAIGRITSRMFGLRRENSR
jgi:hypothetical protein